MGAPKCGDHLQDVCLRFLTAAGPGCAGVEAGELCSAPQVLLQKALPWSESLWPEPEGRCRFPKPPLSWLAPGFGGLPGKWALRRDEVSLHLVSPVR